MARAAAPGGYVALHSLDGAMTVGDLAWQLAPRQGPVAFSAGVRYTYCGKRLNNDTTLDEAGVVQGVFTPAG